MIAAAASGIGETPAEGRRSPLSVRRRFAQVNARHAAIRAEGYPVTLEELDASYKRPTGPNAADVYEEAFSHYVEIAEEKWPLLPIVGDAELPRDGAPLPEETKKLILAHLAANERTLGLLHKAAAVSGCRYPGTLAPGGEWPVAHMRPTPPTWRNCWFSTRW